MSKNYDKTSIGGSKEFFQTTHWSEIRMAGTDDKIQQKMVIGSLMRKYWKPVYCYLRRKGYDNERAKDLTQGFFHEIVLGRELIQQADQSKGRFRTFLLTALDRYVIDIHRQETANKRSPVGKMLQLDDIDLPELPIAASDVTPEQGFHYAWVSDLLDQILTEVKEECYSTGMKTHWEVFEVKYISPIMNNIESLSMAEICTKYGIDNEVKVSNMIVTVKRRLRKALERCLRRFVQSDSDVENELYELLKNLSKNSAR